MKYLLSIIFLLTSCTFVFSQNILDYKEYYVGTGYAVGIRSFAQINAILDDYNDNVNDQEKGFGNFNAPNGITFLAGTTQGFFNIEVGFSQVQQRRKSKFIENDILLQKDARLRINTYFLSTGMFFPVQRGFGFGANASLDYHRMQLGTREAAERSINRSSFVTPSFDTSLGTTIQLRFYFGQMNDHGTKVMIIPYYSLIFKDLNGKEFDEIVNDWDTDPRPDINQKMSHMGIKFVINYSVRK